MKVNGRLVYLAGVVIIVLSVLMFFGKIGETPYIATLAFVLAYFFGNERAFVKAGKVTPSQTVTPGPINSER